MIRKTTLQNNDNPWHDTRGGNDTKDKVFLLSMEDVLKESYGFDTDCDAYDINRRCAPSSYAVAQGAYQYQGTNEYCITCDNKGACFWCLRSPGFEGDCVAYVDYDGDVNFLGNVDGRNDAVRPVLVLKLKSE